MSLPLPHTGRWLRPAEILLVEDNPGDVRLITDTLHDLAPPHRITTVEDGAQAIDLLLRRPPFTEAPRPDLVILDLNLPKLDGHHVLSFIKSNQQLRSTPTLVLTSSASISDIRTAYDLHANCYIIKPHQLGPFRAVLRSLVQLWLVTASLPRQRHA